MRPSSSTSDELFAALSGSAEVDRALSDTAVVRAMLEVEAALALAGADVGLVPADCAADIAAACRSLAPDPGELGRAADASGNPVVPLVALLGDVLPDRARPWVHHGATSQDILDTALMLVSRAAGELTLGQLDAVAAECARHAEAHRNTIMPARTLGQQAVPTTFGLVAAAWLVAVEEASGRLRELVSSRLAVQLGGAAGTLAGFGEHPAAVPAALARRLGLVEPVLPWHTDRQRIVDLAAACGGVLVALGKVALDLQLLAQTEVGEVSEGGAGRGGSSAMPHKRNPVHSVLVGAAAIRAPGLVATLFATGRQEHQRAAGAWHGEWEPLRQLQSLAGGAAERTARMLAELQVHSERMWANLELTGGLLLTERVAGRLAAAIGRAAAHELVSSCAAESAHRGLPLREVLASHPTIRQHLDPADLDGALDPASAVGPVDALIDRALAAYARRDPAR